MTLKTKKIIITASTSICTAIFITMTVTTLLFPKIRGEYQTTLLILCMLVLIFSITVNVYYKKSLPSEIILFSMFLISFSIQSLRMFVHLITFNTFMTGLIIARISLFFKYIGLLSIFGASLFSYTIKKQKIGSWILSTTFISLVIASIIHFNTGIIENQMLPKIIYTLEESILTFSIIILTTLSFIKNGFDAKNKEFINLGIASIAICLSMQLTFISLNYLTGIISAILLIVGSVIYLRSMHYITLWG